MNTKPVNLCLRCHFLRNELYFTSPAEHNCSFTINTPPAFAPIVLTTTPHYFPIISLFLLLWVFTLYQTMSLPVTQGKILPDAWDFKGIPAERSKSGGWTSAAMILGLSSLFLIWIFFA